MSQNIRTRRVGRFFVAEEFYQDLDPDDGLNIFHRMVVLRAVDAATRFATEYTAVHPAFDEVPRGAVIPTYTAVFTIGSQYPTWVLADDNALAETLTPMERAELLRSAFAPSARGTMAYWDGFAAPSPRRMSLLQRFWAWLMEGLDDMPQRPPS